jgi:hypothetical protein
MPTTFQSNGLISRFYLVKQLILSGGAGGLIPGGTIHRNSNRTFDEADW